MKTNSEQPSDQKMTDTPQANAHKRKHTPDRGERRAIDARFFYCGAVGHTIFRGLSIRKGTKEKIDNLKKQFHEVEVTMVVHEIADALVHFLENTGNIHFCGSAHQH